jgi:hypothetical protein
MTKSRYRQRQHCRQLMHYPISLDFESLYTHGNISILKLLILGPKTSLIQGRNHFCREEKLHPVCVLLYSKSYLLLSLDAHSRTATFCISVIQVLALPESQFKESASRKICSYTAIHLDLLTSKNPTYLK